MSGSAQGGAATAATAASGAKSGGDGHETDTSVDSSDSSEGGVGLDVDDVGEEDSSDEEEGKTGASRALTASQRNVWVGTAYLPGTITYSDGRDATRRSCDGLARPCRVPQHLTRMRRPGLRRDPGCGIRVLRPATY